MEMNDCITTIDDRRRTPALAYAKVKPISTIDSDVSNFNLQPFKANFEAKESIRLPFLRDSWHEYVNIERTAYKYILTMLEFP